MKTVEELEAENKRLRKELKWQRETNRETLKKIELLDRNIQTVISLLRELEGEIAALKTEIKRLVNALQSSVMQAETD